MLKSRFRMLIFAALTVMVAGGIASATASAAPKWLVRGTALVGTEGLTTTFLVIEKELVAILTTTLPGGKVTIKISCKKAVGNNVTITAPNTNAASSVSFKECKLDTTSCKLTAAEIKEINTGAISSEAVDLGAAEPFFITLKAAAGGIFVKITLIECAGEGVFNVEGTAACRVLPKVTTEQLLHLCNFEEVTLLSTLKFGTEKASIVAGASFTLVKGGNWSANL
jgi:hypothetical protein